MPADRKDEGKQPGFRVSDRRSFADSGEAKGEVKAEPVAPATAEPASAQPVPPDHDEHGPLPPVDFHTFILSLGSSALLHLGELDGPDGQEARPDLRLAKHTIDIIGMLQEKTRGNLSPPEDRLIESLLYDLRLRYLERGKK
jgi:hypothetical protein